MILSAQKVFRYNQFYTVDNKKEKNASANALKNDDSSDSQNSTFVKNISFLKF